MDCFSRSTSWMVTRSAVASMPPASSSLTLFSSTLMSLSMGGRAGPARLCQLPRLQ